MKNNNYPKSNNCGKYMRNFPINKNETNVSICEFLIQLLVL